MIRLSEYGFAAIQIETQGFCNMRCEFCVFPKMTDRGRTLSTNIIYTTLHKIDPSDNPMITLFRYNEPLIDPRIFTFIDYAKLRGLRTEIRTNGILLADKEIRDNLIAHPPTEFGISLLQTNEEDYQQSRGSRMSWNEYVQGIKDYLGESTTPTTLYIGCNFRKWYSPVKQLLGIEDSIPTIPGTPAEAYKVYFGYPLSLKPFFNVRKLTEFYPASEVIGCSMDTMAIDSNGIVSPCCMTYGDMFSLGNVNETPLEDILENSRERIADMRNGINLPECCLRCQGQPTRRGAMLNSIYRKVKRMV